jgi:hypothetical protein
MPNDYFAHVCVILSQPLELPDEPLPALVATESALISIATESGPAVGYYREIGFRCQPGDVVDVVDLCADDGEIHWGRTEWHETTIDSLPRHVRKRVLLDHDAVWYRGEREYFRRW